MGVPTATDFEKWLKEKMGMSLEEYKTLPQGAKDIIYRGFKAIWRGNPERVENRHKDIFEAIRKAIVEPITTKEELYLKTRQVSAMPFTYGEFISTLSELITWGLIIYRDGRYWK